MSFSDPSFPKQLVDSFGRVHNNLRVSVTDRCNIRCYYCMPEKVEFRPQSEILTFEEISRFVRIVSRMGVNKIRLTGGEPLVRKELPELIRQFSLNKAIRDIALTTNGVLLASQAKALFDSGLSRLNISLDTLDRETFKRISRRDNLEQVLEGIETAINVGFDKIRLNAIAIAGMTEPEIVPLVNFAKTRNLEIRFIEFMPLDAEENWQESQVLTGEKIREIVQSEIGGLVAAERHDKSQPAMDFEFADGNRVGFINPVTQPFCGDCNRLRITAEGQVRNCLFSTVEWDVRKLLRNGASDREIAELVIDSISNKKAGHGINNEQFIRPEKAMYQIGG